MALIICPECKKSISSELEFCSECGFPIRDYINGTNDNSSPDNQELAHDEEAVQDHIEEETAVVDQTTTAANTPETIKVCDSCNYIGSEDEKFCPNCGQALQIKEKPLEEENTDTEAGTEEDNSSNVKVCSNCNYVASVDEKFCPNCGTQLQVKEKTPGPEMSNNNIPEPVAPPIPNQPQKKTRTLLWGVLGIIFCWLIFGIIFGILGLVSAIKAKKSEGLVGGKTIVGLVLSIMAIIFSIVMIAVIATPSPSPSNNNDIIDTAQTETEYQDENAVADAEEPEEDTTVSGDDQFTAEDGDISFRGVNWWTERSDVERMLGLETSGQEKSGDYTVYTEYEEAYRLDGTDSPIFAFGDEIVEGAGRHVGYLPLSVAGYDPSWLSVNYMYTEEDGTINTDPDKAQLYLASYSFDADSYSNIDGLYDDLYGKITELYGEAEDKSSDYLTKDIWTDDDGNILKLVKDSESTYITLSYMAAGSEEKLDHLQELIGDQAISEEEALMEENASNTDGL